MPRYFFNIQNQETLPDKEGNELAGPDAARIAAVTFAGEYVRDHPDMIWDGHRFAVEVRDSSDAVVFRVVVAAEDDTTSGAE